jgi:hypothetical protein
LAPPAGGNQRRPAAANGADRVFLTTMDMGDFRRNPLAHVRMEYALVHQVIG